MKKIIKNLSLSILIIGSQCFAATNKYWSYSDYENKINEYKQNKEVQSGKEILKSISNQVEKDAKNITWLRMYLAESLFNLTGGLYQGKPIDFDSLMKLIDEELNKKIEISKATQEMLNFEFLVDRYNRAFKLGTQDSLSLAEEILISLENLLKKEANTIKNNESFKKLVESTGIKLENIPNMKKALDTLKKGIEIKETTDEARKKTQNIAAAIVDKKEEEVSLQDIEDLQIQLKVEMDVLRTQKAEVAKLRTEVQAAPKEVAKLVVIKTQKTETTEPTLLLRPPAPTRTPPGKPSKETEIPQAPPLGDPTLEQVINIPEAPKIDDKLNNAMAARRRLMEDEEKDPVGELTEKVEQPTIINVVKKEEQKINNIQKNTQTTLDLLEQIKNFKQDKLRKATEVKEKELTPEQKKAKEDQEKEQKRKDQLLQAALRKHAQKEDDEGWD